MDYPSADLDQLHPAAAAADQPGNRNVTQTDLLRIGELFNLPATPEFPALAIINKMNILEANTPFLAMFGYEPEEIGSFKVVDLVMPEARQDLLKNILLQVDKPIQSVGLKKDGTPFPVEISGRVVDYGQRSLLVLGVRELAGHQQADLLETIQQSKATLDEELIGYAIELRHAHSQLQLELEHRRRIDAELKARARQQAAVAELGQRALAGADVSILIDDAAALVGETLDVDDVKILELMPARKLLVLRAGVGWNVDAIGKATVSAGPESLAGYTLESGGAVVVEDFSQESRFKVPPLLGKNHAVSGMNVVIQGWDKPYGVLSVHTGQRRLFNEDDVYFLQSIANVLAMAIGRKQNENQIVQRNHELLALQSANAAIVSSLDLQYVLNTVTREMAILLGAEACAISEWDQATNALVLLVEFGPADWQNTATLPREQSIDNYPHIARVLHDKVAHQLSSGQPDDIESAELHLMRKSNVKSLLMLPMVYQGRVVGLVEVMDRNERLFVSHKVTLAQLLANQAASAIENAWLYAETRKMLREQIALQEAVSVFSSTLDREAVLRLIAEQIGQALDVTSAYICSFEPETHETVVLAEYISGQACPAEQMRDLGATYMLTAEFLAILHSGEPAVLQVDEPDLTEVERKHLEAYGAQSILTLPLQIGGQTIAYAELWESRRRRVFGSEEIALCQGIAQQAAVAIENARLFEQTQMVLADTAALYRVTRTLAQVTDEQEMYNLVLSEYLSRLNLHQGGVLIIEPEQDYGTLRAHMVAGKLVEPGLPIPIAGNPSYDKLIQSQEPVIVEDAARSRLLEPILDLTMELGIKAILLVPIVARGEVIGALGADDTVGRRKFSEREVALVRAMADQLGIAIENLRLSAETQQRAEQLAVLHELDRAITTKLRLTDIYHAFARHAVRLLPYDYMSIALLKGDGVQVVYVAGDREVPNALPPLIITLENSSTAYWVIERNQPVLRHNIDLEAEVGSHEELLLTQEARSLMIIPLRVKGQVIGTWNLGSRRVGAFSLEDLVMAQSMADQLAVAIDNARLYNEIRQNANELTMLNKISQAINSTLNVEETLTIITDYTTQLLGVEAASVALYNEASDELWLVASSGGSADFVRGIRIPKNKGVVGWVFEHGQPVLIPDVALDPRFLGHVDQESGFITRSILCVPLQTKGQTIGAIEAMNKIVGQFEQEDLRLLSLLAPPAATAIENARLYEQAQQEIVERKRAEVALEEERAQLAHRVEARTADLRTANAELARAARFKDEFLAAMSHELRTPLTAILGLSEVLKTEVHGTLTERQQRSINYIEESGRHLLSLINDILDLSKIGAGKLDLVIGAVPVERVCQASLQFIQPSADKKKINISSSYDGRVGFIQADERRLKQILINLLSNAIKFTPDGGKIGLEVVGDVVGRQVRFTIWDTGIGIAAEDIDKLFQPFIQLDSRLSRHYAGTGLGLALVYHMVERHQGQITVESEMERGSRFTVALPWDEAPAIEEKSGDIARQSAETTASKPNAPGTKPLPPLQDQSPLILVVEDEESVSAFLVDYLTRSGYRTVVARNGLEAIDQAQTAQPDIILMDIQMPEMDGLQAIRHIRAAPSESVATIPIIALTALAMPGDRDRCLEAGANEYLSKPLKLRKLIKAIQTQLN